MHTSLSRDRIPKSGQGNARTELRSKSTQNTLINKDEGREKKEREANEKEKTNKETVNRGMLRIWRESVEIKEEA